MLRPILDYSDHYKENLVLIRVHFCSAGSDSYWARSVTLQARLGQAVPGMCRYHGKKDQYRLKPLTVTNQYIEHPHCISLSGKPFSILFALLFLSVGLVQCSNFCHFLG